MHHVFNYLSNKMSITYLKNLLEKVEEIENAGIQIPENLLQSIDSFARQLEPFLKDSPQKAEFDAIQRRETIIDIYLSLWKIFYDDLYQIILLGHMQINPELNKPRFDEDYSVNVRKEDINVKLTQIHSMLVAQWESPIPPQIEHICLSASLLTPEMLYSYITDGQHCGESPIYGYEIKPSLSLDARPLSLEYVRYHFEKADDISDVIGKFNKFTCVEESYNFLCDPESNIELAEEAMKMYGSMKYEEIFRFLNKEYCISNHFYIPPASDDDD
jgi:hypothetical protein